MNHSNVENFENSSYIKGNDFLSLEKTTVSFWILMCYYSFIFLGIVINLLVIFVLLRSKKNGINSSVMQMTTVDVLFTYVGLAETWTLNHHTWMFSLKLCSFYLASEVLANTFILYQTICLNFHIISTVNLRQNCMKKDANKNPLAASYSDNEDSEECLVSTSKNQTTNRNVVIDYRRKKKTDLSIVFPSILVWSICLSISIPQYVLSQAININNNCTLCTIIDIHNQYLLQNLLMVFRIAIPIPLLFLSLLILIKKFFELRHSAAKSQNLLSRNVHNVNLLLTLGVSLTTIYMAMSAQRQVFHLFHMLNQYVDIDNGVNSFKMPPLENNACSYYTNIVSAMVHYSSITLRGMIFAAILPELKTSFYFRKLCSKNVN